MSDILKLVKLCGGVTLRKTSRHDGSNQRFYAYLETAEKTAFKRISKADFEMINSLARVKCAFTTKVLKSTVQYTHSVSI